MIEPIVDISTWQGDVDADKMMDAGAIGMFIRAGSINNSSGICYEDHQFKNNANKFPHRLPCGYYWYFRPNWSGLAQAEYFTNLLKQVKWNLPPVVDVEQGLGDNVSGAQTALKLFVDTVYNLLEVKPIIYTRATIWVPYYSNPSWAKNHLLWIARYTSKSRPWDNDDDPSWLDPVTWDDWMFWQYSADGNGRGEEFGAESDDIDINRCNMTLDEFYEFANWGSPKMGKVNRGCGIVRGEDYRAFVWHDTVLKVVGEDGGYYIVEMPDGKIQKKQLDVS